MEEDDTEFSYLKCYCCQKQEKVIDNGNDIEGNTENGQSLKYKDMISTLLQNKCKSCEKYTCTLCLDECNVC